MSLLPDKTINPMQPAEIEQQAMLRQQQAAVVVAARQRMVEGAVGMDELALHLAGIKPRWCQLAGLPGPMNQRFRRSPHHGLRQVVGKAIR